MYFYLLTLVLGCNGHVKKLFLRKEGECNNYTSSKIENFVIKRGAKIMGCNNCVLYGNIF